MTTDNKLIRLKERAHKAYLKTDESRWTFAFFCGQIVGNYERSASVGLASEMGVSTDTVEDMAHAYTLYRELRQMEGAAAFVRLARKAPYIYLSHFRSLYDARRNYNLSNADTLSLLMDIFQGEGTLSSRDVDKLTRDKYGDTRDWTYYANKAVKSLSKVLEQPHLPRKVRRSAKKAYYVLGGKKS